MNLFLRPIAVLALFFFANSVHAALPHGSGDVVVSIDHNRLVKLNAADGTVLWSVDVANADKVTVDPADLSISTGEFGTSAKVTADGAATTSANYRGLMGGDLTAYSGAFQAVNPADGMQYLANGNGSATISQTNRFGAAAPNWSVDLSNYIKSVDALAVQPWTGGYVYAASVASSKIVVVDSATRKVVTTFDTAIAPRFMAINPNGGNVYVADGQNPFVIAYSPTGSLAWVNLNLGGVVSNIATVKELVGSAAASPCPAPTVKVTTTATSLHKGHSATIDFVSKNFCAPITIQFSVVTHAQAGVDYSLVDSLGNDVTVGGTSSGPLTLTALYNSRRKTLPLSILLLPDPAYYRGNTKVTVQLLGN